MGCHLEIGDNEALHLRALFSLLLFVLTTFLDTGVSGVRCVQDWLAQFFFVHDVCRQFQPCTSSQNNPTPDLTTNPTLWGPRGRQGQLLGFAPCLKWRFFPKTTPERSVSTSKTSFCQWKRVHSRKVFFRKDCFQRTAENILLPPLWGKEGKKFVFLLFLS